MQASEPRSAQALLRLGPRLARAAGEPDEDETLELLRSSVRKLGRRIDSAAIDRSGLMPGAVMQAAREAGLFALSLPEAYGGLGLSLKTACALIDELAQLDRSVAVMIGLHTGLGTRALVRYGTPEQHARLLPRLASGELIAAFAATEAGAGSDLLAVETRAMRAPGGLRVQGQKCYVTNGAFAGLYTLLVRTPELGGARAQSLVCIPAGAPGLRVGAEEDKLGIRASSAVTLDLDDVLVPDDDVLGPPGQGSDECQHVLSWGRTLMSAGCVGTARAALALTLPHVATRRQFGRTLASFPLVQADCADMAAGIYAMESIVRLASDAEQNEPRLDQLSALAKVYCSETAFQICDRAIQLHGALGFLEPTGVARLLRDTRITRIFEGANDVLLVRTGAAALANANAAPYAKLAQDFGATLQESARRVDALLAERDATLARLRKKHGLSLMRKQAVLWAVGQVEVYANVALATLIRASAERGTAQHAVAEHAVLRLVGAAVEQLSVARDPETLATAARTQHIAEQLFAATGQAAEPSRRTPHAQKVSP